MAANTRDIRRRIKSVKNTAQITKAMQMVAASKMRKAQQLAIDGRPYAQLLNRISAAVNEIHGDEKHPLLEQREVKKELLIIISTDKGLCGALNTNLLREAAKFDPEKTVIVTAGR
jgi:F-type H+-transporting ATPase subunit gamma